MTKKEKAVLIYGLYAPLSGTGKVYSHTNQKEIVIKDDGIHVKVLTDPIVIWDQKCTYKQLGRAVKVLQNALLD